MTRYEQDQGRTMQELLNSMSLKDAAVHYAQNGWPVFPLAGKIPYDGMHGHRDATTEKAVIDHWWREHPQSKHWTGNRQEIRGSGPGYGCAGRLL